MSKASLINSSFNGGIQSPLLLGNISSPRRENSVLDLKNMIPLKQGPAERRPGTRYVYEVKRGDDRTGLMEFEFSTEQAYVIEVGELYFRFYMDRGLILNTAVNLTTPYVTKAAETIITSTAHGLSNGDEVILQGTGVWQLDGRPLKVANAGADSFKVRNKRDNAYIDTSTASGTPAAGTFAEVYELVTPYQGVDLFDTDDTFRLRYTQTADVMYLVHPDVKPHALTRTGHTSWTLTAIELVDGPYLATNVTATTLDPSGVSGSITVVASVATGINGGQGFLSTDVGRLIRFQNGVSPFNWTWLEITVVNSNVNVTATVKGPAIEATHAASAVWRLGTYSDTTGWPTAITFHENRICVAGSYDNPSRLDLTMTGGFSPTKWTFSPTGPTAGVYDSAVNPDNGIAYVLGSSGVNVIRWVKSFEKGLAVGTTAAEWLITPSSFGEALTPDNVNGRQSSGRGSANVDAILVGANILFVQRARKRVHELAYVFEVDRLKAPDMTVLSNYITDTGVVHMAFQREPYDCLWLTRDDGTLIGFTYERDDDVVAWHQHVLGGSNGVNQAKAEQLAVIPSPDASRDDVWMIVKRTDPDENEVRYVEYMERGYETDQDEDEAFYVDCGLTYDDSATGTITNLFHLEGETVRVMVNGRQVADQTVSGGKITIPNEIEGTFVHIGFPTDWRIETLPYETALSGGSLAMGKKSKINRLKLLLRNALGIRAGYNDNHLDEWVSNEPRAFNAPPSLFTGVAEVSYNGGINRLQSVVLSHDGGYPATVQAICADIEVIDET